MTRAPSPAARTTLYRLAGINDLREAVQSKYFEAPEVQSANTNVGDRDAIQVWGVMATPAVAWGKTLEGLSSIPVTLGNSTAAAVLVIRNGEGCAWALAYGMGYHLLDQTKVDSGFGQRIAVRVADPTELNSITRTTLDHRSRTDRLSIPSGYHLRGFGVGDFGELVTRLVGKAHIPSLTAGAKPIRIRGSDSLSLPLGRKPAALLTDLDHLEATLASPAAPGLELLEQLVAIKHRPDLIDELEGHLSAALEDSRAARVGLSWPHERIDENGAPTSFRIIGARRGQAGVRDGTPELDALLAAGGPDRDPLARLKAMKVQLYRDDSGQEAISQAIPAWHWLAFETDRAGKRYCLNNGAWYLMDQEYAEKLRRRTKAIFDREPPIQLPEWPVGHDEAKYNALVANALGGTLLDRKLIRTDLHRHGIEPCDVVTPEGALLHIKSIETSAPASHLLAQALVSADALLHDEQARAAFLERVTEQGGDATTIPSPIHTVILGVARPGRTVCSDDLFTFTQVTLVRNVAQLESRGLEVFVAPIVRSAG
jgi:uncharacterized protein (TIGR04141 family)